MGKMYDLTGQTFGFLTAKKISAERHGASQRLTWDCLCVCGNTYKVPATKLRNGLTRSCGCMRSEACKGTNHWRAKQNFSDYGEWISRSDPWYTTVLAAIQRAKEKGIPVEFKTARDFILYLRTIQTPNCPVFDVPMVKGTRKHQKHSPSIDKMIPELGYVKGNIQVISRQANTMKSDASLDELEKFAKWALTFVAKARQMEATHE